MELSDLSMERQFSIRQFSNQIDEMDLQTARTNLKDLFAHHILQRAHFEQLLRHQWGLDSRAYQEILHDLNVAEQPEC